MNIRPRQYVRRSRVNRVTGEVFPIPTISVPATGPNAATTIVFVDKPSLSKKSAVGYAAAGAGITEVVHQLIHLFL